MLAIRMQRVGRRGHAQFRVIVQDKRFSPSSGRVVAYVGSCNPHTKQYNLDKETIGQYISKGAHPTDRVIKLLKQEGVKLPKWVKPSAAKKKTVRNPEKRRSTRPEGAPEPAPKPAEEPAAEAAPKAAAETETPSEESPEVAEPTPEAETTDADKDTTKDVKTEESTEKPAE